MGEGLRPGSMPMFFWSAVFFVFGSMVGSFLNVCIYRLPRGESIVFPRSHCPHCNQAIPWWLNVPLASWLWLRGRCAFCEKPISFGYFTVELLTAVLFASCWMAVGRESVALALACCLVLAGLIVATFIDIEHFIIPDAITLGGMVAGFLASLVAPELHHVKSPVQAMQQSMLGLAAGGGLIYLFLRLGKALFGRQRYKLAPDTRVYFTETSLVLPNQELQYGELLYRKSDAIQVEAKIVELVDRCYRNVSVRMTRQTLQVGPHSFQTEEVPCLEVVTDEVVIPREAMGLGDVKFMAAIGAFFGWRGVVFSVLTSAVAGSIVGLTLILLRRRAWSSRIPYGPYIAAATAAWVFAGQKVLRWWEGL
jgi:leader peptidase (prepilin peptidase)/N-methyltransferase